jgi:hypothetical protein
MSRFFKRSEGVAPPRPPPHPPHPPPQAGEGVRPSHRPSTSGQIASSGLGEVELAMRAVRLPRRPARSRGTFLAPCHPLWQFPRASGGAPAAPCCRSSVVEHSLGKGEVDSSILSGSTRKNSVAEMLHLAGRGRDLHSLKLDFSGFAQHATAGREHLVHDRRRGLRGAGAAGAASRVWAGLRKVPPGGVGPPHSDLLAAAAARRATRTIAREVARAWSRQ